MSEMQAMAEIQASLEARRASAPAKSSSPGDSGDLMAHMREKYPALMAEPREMTAEEVEVADRRESAAKKAERERMVERFFDGDNGAIRVYGACRLRTFMAANHAQREVLGALTEYQASIRDRIAAREGLLLYGPCGTGKDHLAISICRRGIEQHGLTALRINGSDWFGDLRDAMDDENAASEKSMLHKLGAPDLLLVSDPLPPIGNLTQHQATMLYRLVERRYFAGKITLVTVNVADDAEAEARMGVPTWDRLQHRAWKVRCYWESHRQPARVIGVGQ